jgi:hypothetical protein
MAKGSEPMSNSRRFMKPPLFADSSWKPLQYGSGFETVSHQQRALYKFAFTPQ